MLPEVGPLAAGVISFFQIMFTTKHDDGLALIKAFVQAVDQVFLSHDIQDMRADINHLTKTYLGLATALSDYYNLNNKNMPRDELKNTATAVYETFMKPLVGECVGTGKLSFIVDRLITDDRYKTVCIPLAMMAASLWIAYNGLYMQMCAYRDMAPDDAALTYATVLAFIRNQTATIHDNVKQFRRARLQHVSYNQTSTHPDRNGSVTYTYTVVDDAGPDAVPPGMGQYEEERYTSILGEKNSDAENKVRDRQQQMLFSINLALDQWTASTVDDPIKLWWAKFVLPNSPSFLSQPPAAPQVVAGTGKYVEDQGDRWLSVDSVSYAITFKTDRGESSRKGGESYKVQKGDIWLPDFPKDRPPPFIWPIPGHPEMFSKSVGKCVYNARPDLIVLVDDTNPATVRLVYIQYDDGEWEPVPRAIQQLAKDPTMTQVSTC